MQHEEIYSKMASLSNKLHLKYGYKKFYKFAYLRIMFKMNKRIELFVKITMVKMSLLV